jgi:hypothetical protein
MWAHLLRFGHSRLLGCWADMIAQSGWIGVAWVVGLAKKWRKLCLPSGVAITEHGQILLIDRRSKSTRFHFLCTLGAGQALWRCVAK